MRAEATYPIVLLKSWLPVLQLAPTQRNFEVTLRRFLSELPTAARAPPPSRTRDGLTSIASAGRRPPTVSGVWKSRCSSLATHNSPYQRYPLGWARA
jgi:hypothetical protein